MNNIALYSLSSGYISQVSTAVGDADRICNSESSAMDSSKNHNLMLVKTKQ